MRDNVDYSHEAKTFAEIKCTRFGSIKRVDLYFYVNSWDHYGMATQSFSVCNISLIEAYVYFNLSQKTLNSL